MLVHPELYHIDSRKEFATVAVTNQMTAPDIDEYRKTTKERPLKCGTNIGEALIIHSAGGTTKTASDEVRYVVGLFIVHGRVTYKNNHPVRHAMVTVSDTGWYTTETNRCFTDSDGKYTLFVPLSQKGKIDYLTVYALSDLLGNKRKVSVGTNVVIWDPLLDIPIVVTDAYYARFFDAYHDPGDLAKRNGSAIKMEVNVNIDSLTTNTSSSGKRISETCKKGIRSRTLSVTLVKKY